VSLGSILPAAGIESDHEAIAWADIECKYAGYLLKERLNAERLGEMEQFPLPLALDYRNLASLAYEARERLQRLQPRTLGQASRIPGVSPSDLQNLLMELTRRKFPEEQTSSFT
jgi:tRNA uridine 5-carboxymethylaminomethyl modification enzyme